MKKIFLTLFIIPTLSFDAQTLTAAFNEPLPGDTIFTYRIDTAAYTNGLPVVATGSNAVWDFSNTGIADSVTTRPFKVPAAVPESTNYPGCTMVQDDFLGQAYMKSVATPSAQTEVLGLTVPELSITVNFTNSAIMNKYPFSYGNTYTDNIAGTFQYTFSGTCAGNLTCTADGKGTLKTPNGLIFTDILKVSRQQTLTLLTGLAQLASVRFNFYDFYHPSQKFPVFSAAYYKFVPIIGTSTLITVVTGNAKSLLAGVGEYNESAGIAVFPNPASAEIKLGIDQALVPSRVRIIDPSGRIVYSAPFQPSIRPTDLKSGIYFLFVETEKGILREKLVWE